MNCNFADFNIEIKSLYGGLENFCRDYSTDCASEIKMSVTEEEIDFEQGLDEYDHSRRYLETIAFYRKLADWMPQRNAFVLHSALFDVDGTGVAFAAHSGTGKTTHMLLWKELLSDRMTVVNGDKPIVRFFDDEPDTPYGYGTPWNGKEEMGCNMRTPIKHICFIERAEVNSCESMEAKDVLDLVFNQVYMPKDTASVICTMQLINRLINCCKLWKIKCNTDISAAETAYNKIFNNI